MALRITKGSDPIQVEQLTVCVYAPPGVGKTSLGFSAEAPLLLDFDSGAYRAVNRQDAVQVSSWEDVAGIHADDLAPYKTVVVDTAGRALDALAADIIRRNPKMGRGGALTLQGFGQLKSEFVAWTKLLRSFGKDVVLLAHSDEQRSGDEIVERLDVQGGSKNEIYKCADAMGRLKIVAGTRELNFNPTDTAFGKNPAQMGALKVPDASQNAHFLADVIADIKEKLNRMTEEQQEILDLMAKWNDAVAEAGDAETFTALVADAQEEDERVRDRVKGLIWKTAQAKGFTFDKAAGAFKEAA